MQPAIQARVVARKDLPVIRVCRAQPAMWDRKVIQAQQAIQALRAFKVLPARQATQVRKDCKAFRVFRA